MKQKDFDKLNLEKGKTYIFTFRSTSITDKRTYSGSGVYSGQSNPKTDTNIFKTEGWDSSFFKIYTRQLITIK